MKKILPLICLVALPAAVSAQSAMDGFNLSQSDMKGTARFMSMAGAFGALGGDLSVLSQNPGGIGVYRSNEIGFTLDLDLQSSAANSMGLKSTHDQTKFLLNNIGGVATIKLNSESMPNFNIGFTYNKAASYNRAYNGRTGPIGDSMSNYIAGITNDGGNPYPEEMLAFSNGYDPYNPPYNSESAPWISVLGYNGMLIYPEYSKNTDNTERLDWYGLYGNGTSGTAWFSSLTKGGVDEYNISFGGNISNVVFWGMDFGITDINYTRETLYGEDLDGAYAPDPCKANWSLYNYYNMNATGFNYKLGFIVKPIQELRLGFAFHTPTWYAVDETFYGKVDYGFNNGNGSGWSATNDDRDAYNTYNFRTPWRLIFSAAGVIGSKLIISGDYEWEPYNGMHFSDSPQYDSWYDTPAFNSYNETNGDIKNYYKAQHTLRLGAEYRVFPNFSVRAGYSYQSSPVKSEAKNEDITIYTSGTRPQFEWFNATNYITCGVGYRYQKFYLDLAYVYKHQTAEYHAYATDPGVAAAPSSKLSFSNSQVVLSAGFRF